MLAHRGHNFIVQIFDELWNFFFQALGGIAHGLADAGGGVFYFAIEVVHKTPLTDSEQSALMFGCMNYYFARGNVGQWRDLHELTRKMNWARIKIAALKLI